MGRNDERIDAYIAGSAEFARPILLHLRELIHEACPDVEETMKWSRPHFLYNKAMMCGMSAFKEHCAFGFWMGSLVLKDREQPAERGMGQFGKITKLADLPSDDVLAGFIREAMRVNEQGIKPDPATKPKRPPKEPIVPEDLTALLSGNETARATFEKFSTSHRREYVEWITEAKTEATRSKRLATTLEWLAEGKPRHWKYVNC